MAFARAVSRLAALLPDAEASAVARRILNLADAASGTSRGRMVMPVASLLPADDLPRVWPMLAEESPYVQSEAVHLSYVREKTGHALAGARQWIPAENTRDPVKPLVTALPSTLRFQTKGELAIGILDDAYRDGLAFDFVCADEVYGSCTELRRFLEGQGQAYVLRVASNFTLALAAGTKMTCADAVKKLLKRKGAWEVRSAGSGSKGERWYAWAWLATASPRHSLLVRRHLKTGEFAFHYCYMPGGQLASKARLIRAAGLRWPVEWRRRNQARSRWFHKRARLERDYALVS